MLESSYGKSNSERLMFLSTLRNAVSHGVHQPNCDVIVRHKEIRSNQLVLLKGLMLDFLPHES